MTSSPLSVEPWQVVLERALAHPEHIGSLTSQHPADEAPAMSGEPYDLLYGDARLGLFEDSRVGVLSPKIALVLEALGGGQQAGIYGSGADRDADLAHGFAYRIEEGAAGILHEVPTVGDLGGMRERLGCSKGVTAAAIARDHSDLWLPRQPGLRGGWLSVR
jgi:hypothetical protein